MLTCTVCGASYQPSSKGPKVKYTGLCQKCRKKKHTATHIEKNKETYLQKHRFYHKKYAYGIDAAEFEKRYLDQDGKCAICGTSFPPLTERRKLIAVDHDHMTGFVRGLLCGQCNTAVGMVKESVTIAERLVAYLQMHKPLTD